MLTPLSSHSHWHYPRQPSSISPPPNLHPRFHQVQSHPISRPCPRLHARSLPAPRNPARVTTCRTCRFNASRSSSNTHGSLPPIRSMKWPISLACTCSIVGALIPDTERQRPITVRPYKRIALWYKNRRARKPQAPPTSCQSTSPSVARTPPAPAVHPPQALDASHHDIDPAALVSGPLGRPLA